MDGRDGVCMFIEYVWRAVVPSIHAIPQIIFGRRQRVVLKKKAREIVLKDFLVFFPPPGDSNESLIGLR